MSPRMRLTPSVGLAVLAGGASMLLSACGAPPEPLPTSPPYSRLPSAPPSGGPSIPAVLPTVTGAPPPTGLIPGPGPGIGGNPGYPANPVRTTTAGPATITPTPTPKHAPKCTGEPTGAQILTLIKGRKGVPDTNLTVIDGPRCASTWSFTSVARAGKPADQQDPLFVVAVGTGTDLALVTAGSEVCNTPVQQQAPAGIRVLACGF